MISNSDGNGSIHICNFFKFNSCIGLMFLKGLLPVKQDIGDFFGHHFSDAPLLSSFYSTITFRFGLGILMLSGPVSLNLRTSWIISKEKLFWGLGRTSVCFSTCNWNVRVFLSKLPTHVSTRTCFHECVTYKNYLF